ncbi:hypothetical protein OOU_Y34scaffold00109g6 [Pyricularia oryzae Y34]|uniref:Uncharacterized protein n=2 Tax=Pyricularia oryzae TaxID=318829 RepID=A0AA97P8M6_PYRO3|nr:hypothetical protein OOU_Y34scaffold00109g6 [Pyricularia oryzae Y34]
MRNWFGPASLDANPAINNANPVTDKVWSDGLRSRELGTTKTSRTQRVAGHSLT